MWSPRASGILGLLSALVCALGCVGAWYALWATTFTPSEPTDTVGAYRQTTFRGCDYTPDPAEIEALCAQFQLRCGADDAPPTELGQAGAPAITPKSRGTQKNMSQIRALVRP